jgi:hypothetical protein
MDAFGSVRAADPTGLERGAGRVRTTVAVRTQVVPELGNADQFVTGFTTLPCSKTRPGLNRFTP